MKRKIFNRMMALLMAGTMTFSSVPISAVTAYAAEVTEEAIVDEDAEAVGGEANATAEDAEAAPAEAVEPAVEAALDAVGEAVVGEAAGSDNVEEVEADISLEELFDESVVSETEEGEYYVLLNIPYELFYAAEGDSDVDAVASATKAKPRYPALAGGSYHVDNTGADITGITYPVKLNNAAKEWLEAMQSGGQAHLVTDTDYKSYTINLRGRATDVYLAGKEVLLESPTYSYYVLDEAPASYKELILDDEGEVSFGPATGTVNTVQGLTATNVSHLARHADVEITLDGVQIPTVADGEDPVYVNGVVVTDKDGKQYALRHVSEIWRNTQIGWNYDDEKLGALTFNTITNVRYYLSDGSITDYPCEIDTSAYFLMNIPYGEFYAEEGDSDVDAVASATKAKPRATTLAGGSYHIDETGSDITGVVYPVRISDMDTLMALKAKTEAGTVSVITDRSSKEYTIKLRGQDTTFTLTGKQVLMEAPTYSYYSLGTEPVSYKEATVSGEGFAFGKATGEVTSVDGVTASKITYFARHADIEIKLDGLNLPTAAEGEEAIYVNGVVITDEDGTKYALRHVKELWRGTEFGWNFDDEKFEGLTGKTITNLRYYMSNGAITDYPCEIDTSAYFLMNIPYGEFYAEEGDSAVDAVTSATMSKPRAITLAGGSYHVNSDGSDITGVVYPVKLDAKALAALKAMKTEGTISVITDESSLEYTVKLRGQDTQVVLAGKQVLFEAPSYSYYLLSEKPASYKDGTVDESGAFAFGKASGEVSTVDGLTGKVTLNAHHADVEIVLNGVVIPEAAEGEEQVYVNGLVVTDENGSQYALRHVCEIWRSTQIGWNYDDAKLGGLTGTTIKNIRYYLSDGSITDYPCEITYKVAKYNDSTPDPQLVQADDQTQDQFITYLQGITTVSVNGTEYKNAETPIIVIEYTKGEDGRTITGATAKIDLNVEADGKQIFDGSEEYKLVVKATAHDDYEFTLSTPIVTKGGDPSVKIGYDDTLGFSTDGNPAYFRAVRVDGKVLKEGTDYTIPTNETDPDVILTGEFMKSLAVGTYDVEVVYANGPAATTLTIKPIEVESVKLNKTSATLLKGKTLKLAATISPENATNKTITWKSSNTKVATVDKNGKVTARKTGTAKITATSSNGKKAVCTVKVYERIPLYRFYNRKTGDHMYTISEAERKALIKAGWKAEGVACHVPKTSSKPVYRLYNKSNGDHMFTMSAGERKTMIKAGWIDEGIGFYSETSKKVPMYRLYNPNAKTGYHFFTGSTKERDNLIKAGWKYEKVGFYGN